MELSAMGDDAVVLSWTEPTVERALAKVGAAVAALDADPPHGLVDIVPAFNTVTVFYNVLQIGYAEFAREVALCAQASEPMVTQPARLMTIPVCYGGEMGPDMDFVARQARLTMEQVVALHADGSYTVGAIGFTPGFPYLLGMPETLRMPRRSTPRLNVPAGSVGIGGAQTGVYPLASPGGWQLIGRTPLPLFDMGAREPVRLRVGDQVRFNSITPEEFAAWR